MSGWIDQIVPGPAGPTGPTGPAGPSGPTGATGSIWYPEIDTVVSPRVGDFAMHTFAPGATWVYRYDGVTPGYVNGWAQVASIAGPTGPTGPTGPSGLNHSMVGPWGATNYEEGATGGTWQWLNPNPMGEAALSSVTDSRQPTEISVPRACVVTGMRCTFCVPMTADVVFTLFVEGVATACTATIAEDDDGVLATGFNVSVSAGQRLAIRAQCPDSLGGVYMKASLAVTWL